MGVQSHQRLFGLFEGLGMCPDAGTPGGGHAVQMIAYLAQACGIDLGYRYSWYLRGPYSRDAARDGLLMRECARGGAPAAPPGGDIGALRALISAHTDDPLWLETAASAIHLHRHLYAGRPLGDLVGHLLYEMAPGHDGLAGEDVQRVVDCLLEHHLLEDVDPGHGRAGRGLCRPVVP